MDIVPMLELPKKYGCPVCPKSFETLAVKKAHIKTQHPKKEKK